MDERFFFHLSEYLIRILQQVLFQKIRHFKYVQYKEYIVAMFSCVSE